MNRKAVIFDMDGLLIDSEPLWQEAGIEALYPFGIRLSLEQYHSSTGLRTREWVDHWFRQYQVDAVHAPVTITKIESDAIEKIRQRGEPMPGVRHALNFFRSEGYQIGLASSSPMQLIDVVVDKLGIRNYLDAISSAGELAYGKPHPQVFINCAEALDTAPFHCICFEDSFNGMIAAKAAKMKCVVVPAADQYQLARWGAADLKLSSLQNINQLLLESLWRV